MIISRRKSFTRNKVLKRKKRGKFDTNILTLPDDCIFVIFTFFTQGQLRNIVKLICKRFFYIIIYRIHMFEFMKIDPDRRSKIIIREQNNNLKLDTFCNCKDVCACPGVPGDECEPKNFTCTKCDITKFCKSCRGTNAWCAHCTQRIRYNQNIEECNECGEGFCYGGDLWPMNIFCGKKCKSKDCEFIMCNNCINKCQKIKNRRCKGFYSKKHNSRRKHINCFFCPEHGCSSCLNMK